MVGPLAIAGIAAAGVSTGASIFGSRSAAKEQEEVAERQAKLTFATRMEELRRRQYQMTQVEGAARAAAGASGVQLTGSTQRYLNEMRSEHQRQISWQKKSASLEKRNIEKGGQTAASTLNAEMIGKAASGISSMIGIYNAGK